MERTEQVRARSGTPVEDITLDGVLAGEVSLDDIRIHPDTLIAQAEVATRAGNPQLGENFRRASELTVLTDERVLAIYEALRPHRSSAADLERIATELDDLGAARNAALVREAATVYQARGLLR